MKHMKVSPFEKKKKSPPYMYKKNLAKSFGIRRPLAANGRQAGSKINSARLPPQICALRQYSSTMESEEAPVQDEQHFDELPFGGYDFVFVDEPSPGQTCSICLTAMRNPVQTFCGHRFCEECLVGTFR